MSAAEKRRQKLLMRSQKVEAGETIGSSTLEEVKQEKKEIIKKIEEDTAKEEILKVVGEQEQKIDYKLFLKLQQERKNYTTMLARFRTCLALIFGIWCHFVHATEFRLVPYANLFQTVFSLPTYLFIELFFFVFNQQWQDYY